VWNSTLQMAMNVEYQKQPVLSTTRGGDAGPVNRSGGMTIYREKQVKVLRSSHVLHLPHTANVHLCEQ
jgi:hypothetical protein